MQSKDGISSKQFVVLLFLVTLAIKMFMLPSLILRTVGKDGYLVIVAYTLFEFVGLGLLLAAVVRNPDKTLFDILSAATGKVVSRIIVTFIIAFALVKATIVISEIKMFFAVIMYRDINWAILAVPLFAVLTAMSVRPLRSIGRTAELVFPVVALSTFILAALLFGDIRPENLLPVMPEGAGKVADGVGKFAMWFGDTTFLALFLGRVKVSRKLVAGAFIAKLVASLIVIFFTVVLFASYANVSTLIDYGNNVSNMTQLSLGSQDYGRFDLLFYCVWIFSVFLKLGIVFCLITQSVSFLFSTDRKYLVSIIMAAVVFVITTFFIKNEEVSYLFATGAVRYFVFPAGYLTPAIAFACGRIAYKPNRFGGVYEQNEDERQS